MPQTIYFNSRNWNAWYEAFEKLGIKTEDALNIRHSKSIYIKFERVITMIGYIIAAVLLLYLLSALILEPILEFIQN